jgi:D-alanine-D-alanine ligase
MAALAVLAGLAVRRAAADRRPVVLTVALAAGTLAVTWWLAASGTAGGDGLTLANDVALIVAAVAVVAGSSPQRWLPGAIHALVVDLGPSRHPELPVSDLLAGTLADPELEVRYAIPGRGWVDEQGRAVEPPPAAGSGNDRVTRVPAPGGGEVALIGGPTAESGSALSRAAAIAAALALENARISAEVREQAEAVRESRKRLLAVADEERQALAARLVAGERYDLVFSIAEGLKGRSREAQVPALCELFEQPYLFSDPLTAAAALDKAVAKRLVRDAGVPTPAFAVAKRSASDLAAWTDFPAFVKPLAEGTGKGCEAASLVQTEAELFAAATRVIERYNQPALVEQYLPGREFTVGIVGNGDDARVIGVCEILLKPQAEANVYSLHNKELCEELVIYAPASDDEAHLAGTRALQAYRALECRDTARIDFRSDAKGEPYFLEANPLAGLNPSHSDLPILAAQNGIEFVTLIGMILDAGLARYGRSRQAQTPRRKRA